MAVKRQHYVPQVYLKAWETRVSSKKEPDKYFTGINYYEKNDLLLGDGRNKDSILWKSRIYTINFDLNFIFSQCPEIEKDYVQQIAELLKDRKVFAKYNGKVIQSKRDMAMYLRYIDDWEFNYKNNPDNKARKVAIINDIKSINSYAIENKLDEVVEKKWKNCVDAFLYQAEHNIPINKNSEDEKIISEDTVLDIVKMILFMMCRNPGFEMFGIIPFFRQMLTETFFQNSPEQQKQMVKLADDQIEGLWLVEIYKGLYEVPRGVFYNLKETVGKSHQLILFECWENQGSFITSDNPSFTHISLVEAENFNSIICPLTPKHLVMILKGEENSINTIKYRRANNELIRKFNTIIYNNADRVIVSDQKRLGFLL